MKKSLFSALAAGVLVLAPVQMTFAQTPSASDQALIQQLEAEIATLTQQIAIILQQRLSAQPNHLEVDNEDTGKLPDINSTSTSAAEDNSTVTGSGSSSVTIRGVSITETIMNGVPCGSNSLTQTTTFKPGQPFCLRFSVQNRDESLPHGYLDDQSKYYDRVSIDTPTNTQFTYSLGNNQWDSHWNQSDNVYVQATPSTFLQNNVYALRFHVAARKCTRADLYTNCGGWTDGYVSANVTVASGVAQTGISFIPNVTNATSVVGSTPIQNGNSTSTLTAQFNVSLKAVGGDVQFASNGSTNGAFSPDLFSIFKDGTQVRPDVTMISSFAIPSSGITPGSGNVAFTLPQNSQVTVPVTFYMEGKTRDGQPIASGQYRVELESVRSLNASTQAIATSISLPTVSFPGTQNTTVIGTTGAVPTVSVTASPTSVSLGGSSTITYSAGNATSCTIDGQPSALAGMSPSIKTVSPTQTTTYTATCSNSNGSNTANATVTVNPAQTATPSVALTVNGSHGPVSVTSGSSPTLSWTLGGSISSCSIAASSGKYSYLVNNSGSVVLSNITESTTITAVCNNGAATDQMQVNVSAPVNTTSSPSSSAPVLTSFAASPSSITAGQPVTVSLYADLSNAANKGIACTVSPLVGSGLMNNNVTVYPGSSTTFTATCTNSAGLTTTKTSSVTVSQQTTTSTTSSVPSVSVSASPSSISAGGSTTITWSSTNASYCSWTAGSKMNPNGTAATLVTSGSQTVTPVAGTDYSASVGVASYYVSCYNGSGGATGSTNVTVNTTGQTSAAYDAIEALIQSISASIANLSR